ncbi:MAG: glycosyltransferase family 4 protein [Chryseolinea sp.]
MTHQNNSVSQPSATGDLSINRKIKLLRITTVPISLQLLLKGQFRYMIDQGYEVITVSAEGSGAEDVKAEGAQHIAIPFTRKITPIQDLVCLFKLIDVIKEIRPDIIHTHTPKAGLLGMLAGRICNVPVRMHTVAGLPLMEAKGFKRRILEFTERLTYSAAHRVYPNSKGLEDYMIREFQLDPQKVGIIGKGSSNGIDTTYFSSTPELIIEARSIRNKYNVRQHDIVFGFIGRVVRDKGIVELVSAFKRLRDNLNRQDDSKSYYLLIVGPFEELLDPLPSDVMTFLKEDPNVILPGFQKDVRPWLMASDIFVFPSYREGFPNVVMQASLLEVPSIVSDINGCNEIIEDGVRGLIVSVKNVDQLLNTMQTLAGDSSMRKKYAMAAKTFVENNYDRNVVWSEIRKEYEMRLGMVTNFKGSTED